MLLQPKNAECSVSQCSQDSNPPNSLPSQKSLMTGINLKRFYGMGSAAVGLLEFNAKYGRKSSNENELYDEFDNARFFDSRDYRCCFSIFHAKIGTFVLCTLILHEIVLGTLYILTQFDNPLVTSNLTVILICRLLQLPAMMLLYIGLWRYLQYLLLPFAFAQITIGAFSDFATLTILLENLKRKDSVLIFSEELKFLNFVVPITLYILVTIFLLWVLYKCFNFLKARREHDTQRQNEKEKKWQTFVLKSFDDETNHANVDDISTSGLRSPNSVIHDESFAFDQSLHPANGPTCIAHNNSSQCSNQCHLRTNCDAQHKLHATLSAVALSKQFGNARDLEEESSIRSSTLPPHLVQSSSVLAYHRSPISDKFSNRRRLFSEKANDLETTMFLIRQKNTRNVNRCFKGSVYSLQDTLRFQMINDYLNSSNLTISGLAATASVNTLLNSTNTEIKNKNTPSYISSSNPSTQSLTVIEMEHLLPNDEASQLTPKVDQEFNINIDNVKDVIDKTKQASLISTNKHFNNSNDNLDVNFVSSAENETQKEPVLVPTQQNSSRFSTLLVKEMEEP